LRHAARAGGGRHRRELPTEQHDRSRAVVRVMRALWTVGLLLAALGVFEPTAGAAAALVPALRPFADGLARTDGRRFVDVVRMHTDASRAGESIYDEHTGARRTVKSACEASSSLSPGFTVLGCGLLSEPARVWDLARNTSQVLAPIPVDIEPDSFTTVPAIGARWMVLHHVAYHNDAVSFEDWRGGQVRTQLPANSYPDLDAPRLVRRLCRPLRRGQLVNDSGQLAYQYERPYAQRQDAAGLLLDRCGRPTPRVLAPGGTSGQLGAGVVTWTTHRSGGAEGPERTTLHALILKSNRHLTWRFAFPPHRARINVAIEHTRRAVYVNRTDPYHGTYTVLRARLPDDAKG
jgi:hypothetical protein